MKIINGRGQKKSKGGEVCILCSAGKMWTTIDLCGDGIVLHLHCRGGYGSLHMGCSVNSHVHCTKAGFLVLILCDGYPHCNCWGNWVRCARHFSVISV